MNMEINRSLKLKQFHKFETFFFDKIENLRPNLKYAIYFKQFM